jgi:hypothetical protein
MLTTKADQSGAESANVRANVNYTQTMSVSDGSPVAGTSVSFPPGSLAVDSEMTIEEGVTLATEGLAAELGIGENIDHTVTAVSVQPTKASDPAAPYTVTLGLSPSAGLLDSEDKSKLIVLYKVRSVAEKRILAGIIPRKLLEVDGNLVKFTARHFGVFQLVYTKTIVAQAIEIEVQHAIQVKREVAALPAFKVTSRSPFIFKAGERIEVVGVNFRPTMTLAMGGKIGGNVDIASDVSASFTAPDYDNSGVMNLTVDQDGVSQTVSLVYQPGDDDIPLITRPETDVCQSEQYYDASGKLRVGIRSCDARDFTELKAEVVKVGVNIAGIVGTYSPDFPDPKNVYNDTVDGVSGTLTLPPANKVENTVGAFGAGGLSHTSSYVPADLPAVQNVLETDTVGGSFGTLKLPAIGNVYSGTQYGAGGSSLSGTLSLPSSANVRVANGPFGQDGNSITPSLADCSTNGGFGCFIGTGFKAASSVYLLAENIRTGIPLGGVTGTLVPTPANCGADGATGCVAVVNFPAVDKVVKLTGASAKIRNILTIAGVTGTLADCTEGDSTCYVGLAHAAATISGAADKIIDGQTVAGISGTVTLPSTGKVLLGTSFGVGGTGSAGTLTLSPAAKVRVVSGPYGEPGNTITPTLADCISEGQDPCVTGLVYKAANMSYVTPGNIKDGVTIAGVTGGYPSATYPLPGATGIIPDLTNFNTQLTSAGTFEFWDSAGTRSTGSGDAEITAANVANGITFENLSVTGAFAPPCTTDGALECKTNSQFKAINTGAISSWDIRRGKFAGGIAGELGFFKNLVGSYDRITGTASTIGIDSYDTVDDYNNGGSLPGSTISPYWGPAPGLNWLRDEISDTGAGGGGLQDGTCNGTEICIYIDRVAGNAWLRDDTTTKNWEAAISYCDGLNISGNTGWRLPTQKELMQAYTDGIWGQKLTDKLSLGNYPYWSASTQSGNDANGWIVHISSGLTMANAKTNVERAICVH